MIIDLEYNRTTGWTVATLVASSLTLFISLCYTHINSVYKRRGITWSVFFSALFSLTSVAIVFAEKESSNINLSVLFVFRGIQYAFAFNTMLYVFYRHLVGVEGEEKSLVYIGYMWLFVVIGVSLAATLMTHNISWNFYNTRDFKKIYNVIAVTMLSSWGFVAVIILLYIRNKQRLYAGSEASVIIYIFLVLIQTITTTAILYSPSGDNGTNTAFVFFLVDLPMDIAILIAAHYGPVWIGDKLKGGKSNVNNNSGDLEASRGYN
ncbi:hypothetical protein EDC94DRAFT_654933 [Helicostylum pulchrum]|nr:hypothetical protein EDC94DRAFT_654933 [Helicostylum pulchrum]